MKLTDVRKLFKEVKEIDERISVRPHAWRDHPERKFTALELVRLIRGGGGLHDNNFPSAQPGSFLWKCKDDNGKKAEIAIVFEESKAGEVIVIIHAYREVQDENSNRK